MIKNNSLKQYRRQELITITTFLAIPLILLFLFTYLPFLDMFRYSFLEWNGMGPKKYIGLDNYKLIFTKPEYFKVFKVSLYYFLCSILQIGFALFFASIFFYGIRGSSFFKGVLFFPSLLNGVAVGFVFLAFFKGDGTLNAFLLAIGFPKEAIPLWLGNPKIINFSLAFVSLWKFMGQNMIIFAGTMESIPKELFESAQMDGANKWKQFTCIILPNLKLIISLNLILAIKGAISVFEIPFIMTNGNNGSMTFVMQTLDTAFLHKKIGLASAMGIILLIITMIVTFIQKRFIEGKDN